MRSDRGGPQDGAPHRVAVLAIGPVIGYDLAIPTLMFAEATDGPRPLYDVRVAAVGGRPVPAIGGYTITPDHDESALAWADTIVVPGTRIHGAREEGRLPDDLREALDLRRPDARLVSICTGAFVLAAAGLLDGRPATTHWNHLETFARLYPRVELRPDVLFVDDGDLLTSAGLAAGNDLCLHLIRRDHDSRVATTVARHCVVPPWREGGQAQFIETPLPQTSATSTAAAREWALRRLGDDLPVSALAARAGMSLRTFGRRFHAETGQTPAAWITTQRVRHARRLLEDTDLPVDAVAARSGLGTASSLRRHLADHLGVSPSSYRRTFRGT